MMSEMGEYLFVVHAVDDHPDEEKCHRRKPALPLNARIRIQIEKVRIFYHNDTCSNNPYPFTNDTVSIRALVWVRTGDGGYYPFWSTGFANDGHWFATGTQGDSMPAPNDRWTEPSIPLLSDQRVYRWHGPSITFAWYRLRTVVDEETMLTSRRMNPGPPVDCYYLYPPYEPAGITSWGTTVRAGNLVPGFGPGNSYHFGTVRLVVRINWRDASGNHVMFSLTPTPGDWRAPANDEDLADWDLLWSQNCDENNEYAVRISVRYDGWPEDLIPSERQRWFLQWASAYHSLPSEWGGSWFGGRTDDKLDRSGRDDADNHYGIDCSGLVSAAAGWVGYNWDPWRTNVDGIINRSRDLGQTPDVRPGDVLTLAGHHVRIVFDAQPGHYNQADSETLESAGDEGSKITDDNMVRLRRGVKISDLLKNGYEARRLNLP